MPPKASKPPKPLQLEPLDRWVETTRRLLARERDEELALVHQELAALDDRSNPNVLTGLRLTQRSTALFGRALLQFALPPTRKVHQFTVGDLVQLRLEEYAKFPTGIVARVEDAAIAVALGENEELDEAARLFDRGLTLDRLVNNATFTKIADALEQLGKSDFGAAQAVADVVFGGKAPSWNPLPEIAPFTDGLNASQVEAIRFALASKDLALIHGPPGTGKTTTVVELILQAVQTFGLKVLVCAPSNIAVDNVLEKLASANNNSKLKRKLALTRVGHPARLLPQVLRYCLDAKIAAAEGTEIVDDIRKEMAAMQAKLSKTSDKGVRFSLRRDLKANRKEIRQREQKVVGELVKHSDVVFATTVGAASKLLRDVTFDLVVIDEAAQALEASCWIPILKATRCVLAGDHRQLPPTIKSKAAAADGLEVTLFDRLTRFPGTQCIVKMLKVQYRMHERISDWSSCAMYNGELESFEGVAKRKLHELSHVAIREDDELLNATLLLLDTAGCGLEEDRDDQEERDRSSLLQLSKSNEGEARVVEKHVRALLRAGLKQEEVAIITPYNKQVQALRALLLEAFPKLEIRSVDGFQGCEKEAVVMSLVRSNDAKQVGFLADDRRMNVAITRAKRHVAVVCDTETISAHTFLDALVKHFETYGEYRSAQEYLDEDLVHGSADVSSVKVSPPPAAAATGATVASATKATAATKTPSVAKAKPSASSKSQSAPKEEVPPKVTNDVAAKMATSGSSNAAPQHAKPDSTPSSVVMAEAHRDAAEVDGSSAASEDEAADTESVNAPSVFQLMSADSSDSDGTDDEAEEKAALADSEPANALLKELHLARLSRQPPPPPASVKASKSKKGKKNKKKASSAPPARSAPVDERKEGEDELEFLERQAKRSSKCAFQSASRCNKSVAVMGSVCKFCKLKFCYDHGLPEAHGCGDAVRQFERAQFQQQQMRSKPANAKPLTADKRKLLKKKLDEKVTGMTAERRTKGKSEKK